MSKLSKLFLMGAIALGLAACNNDDVPGGGTDNGPEGNTHVAVALALGSNTRALPTDYNHVGEWAGRDQIKTVDIYLIDGASGTVSRSPFGVDTAYTQSGNVLVPTTKAAIRTTAGRKTVYVVINTTNDIVTALSSTNAATFDEAYKNVALTLVNSGTSTTVNTSAQKLVVENSIADPANNTESIVMTNVANVTVDVEPGVKKEETVPATGTAKNRASVSVDRTVARVMVTKVDQATFEVRPNGGALIGTVSDVNWVVAQGENKLFIQRKSDWATPSYGWNPGVGPDNFETQAGTRYDYSGLFVNYNTTSKFGGTTVPPLSAYVALAADNSNKDAVLASLGLDANAVNGKFILPNTHLVGAIPAAGANYLGGYKKGNTAYVLIRAKFTPDPANVVGGTYTPGNDFWLGQDGKFYLDGATAIDPNSTGNKTQNAAKYVGGKVLYYAWVNPDVTTNWYNSPAIRNNVYHIHITGFKTIGTNWNPLYPEDPDTPTPDNPDPKPGPDEPNNPIDPEDPLTTPETWMSVDVTVLPWQVHSYNVILGI